MKPFAIATALLALLTFGLWRWHQSAVPSTPGQYASIAGVLYSYGGGRARRRLSGILSARQLDSVLRARRRLQRRFRRPSLEPKRTRRNAFDHRGAQVATAESNATGVERSDDFCGRSARPQHGLLHRRATHSLGNSQSRGGVRFRLLFWRADAAWIGRDSVFRRAPGRATGATGHRVDARKEVAQRQTPNLRRLTDAVWFGLGQALFPARSRLWRSGLRFSDLLLRRL